MQHKVNGKKHLTWTLWVRARVRKGEKEERRGEKEMEEKEQTPRAEAKAVVQPQAMPGHRWCATGAAERDIPKGYVLRR